MEALHATISSPTVCQYLFTENPFTLTQTKHWLDSMIASYQETGMEHMAVLEQESGQFIGFSGLSLEEVDGETFYEIGCVLGKAHWGKGYASESLQAILEATADHLDEIIGIIKVGHEASIALSKKLGFTFWKETRYEGEHVLIYRR